MGDCQTDDPPFTFPERPGISLASGGGPGSLERLDADFAAFVPFAITEFAEVRLLRVLLSSREVLSAPTDEVFFDLLEDTVPYRAKDLLQPLLLRAFRLQVVLEGPLQPVGGAGEVIVYATT